MTNEKVKLDFTSTVHSTSGFTFEYVELQNDPHKDGFTFHPICKSSEDTAEMTPDEFSKWMDWVKKGAVVTMLSEHCKCEKNLNHVLSSGVIRDPNFPNDLSAFCFTLKFTTKD